MRFGIDRDRMVAYWTPGEEDLAMALVAVEGFEIARANVAGLVTKYRTLDGWERRVVYASKRREAERLRRQVSASSEGLAAE